MPLRQEVTQSHTEDLRDLLHEMHPVLTACVTGVSQCST